MFSIINCVCVSSALLLWLVTSPSLISCDDNLFVTIEEVPEPGSNTSVVGPPGPVGLVGLPGPKGATGSIGTCQCDIERVKRQHALLEKFKIILPSNAEKVTFNFKQFPDSCSVGVKTGRLPNSSMTASSTASSIGTYAAHRGRVDNLNDVRKNGGSWLPLQDLDVNWLQVELDKPKKITGVITQGYPYFDAWVSTYKIAYSNQTSERSFIQEDGKDKVEKNLKKTNCPHWSHTYDFNHGP